MEMIVRVKCLNITWLFLYLHRFERFCNGGTSSDINWTYSKYQPNSLANPE